MQREQEHDELVALARKVVNERQQFVDALMGFAQGMRTPPGCGFVKYLEANAPHIRDLLEPFDNRVQQVKCEATFARDENFAVACERARVDGSAFVYRTEYDKVLAQLAAIAQAVKPLRDWYYAEHRPEGLLCLSSYGHEVRNGDFVKLFEACPRPGSIVDAQA
jgi:hypothetical protein